MHSSYNVSKTKASQVNVLVFSGSGVSPSCLLHLKTALQSLLSTRYDVQSISAESLIRNPWTENCALLAFPGGRDLGYLSSLGDAGCKRIADWVHEGGGRYLGLCAGAYFASDRIEFECGREGFEIIGDRPLKLFPGACKGSAFPGFVYNSEEGARAAVVSLESEKIWRDVWQDSPPKLNVYYNGGGFFEEVPESHKNVTIIARYDELENKPAAGVLCRVGETGKAILWGVHPEHPSSLAASYMSTSDTTPQQPHYALMRATLQLLDLEMPQEARATVRPSPLLLTCVEPLQAADLTNEIISQYPNSDAGDLCDVLDTFVFHQQSHLAQVFASSREKHDSKLDLVVCSDTHPPHSTTPLFDLNKYYALLVLCRRRLKFPFKPNFGSDVLYGEVVTSTQTILDK